MSDGRGGDLGIKPITAMRLGEDESDRGLKLLDQDASQPNAAQPLRRGTR
jgi:hypothetical protein